MFFCFFCGPLFGNSSFQKALLVPGLAKAYLVTSSQYRWFVFGVPGFGAWQRCTGRQYVQAIMLRPTIHLVDLDPHIAPILYYTVLYYAILYSTLLYSTLHSFLGFGRVFLVRRSTMEPDKQLHWQVCSDLGRGTSAQLALDALVVFLT